MTRLAVGHAYVLKDSTFTLGGTTFAAAATTAMLKPTTAVKTLTTLIPDGVYQDVDTTIWVLSLAGISDWKMGGLAKYLNDHVGESVAGTLAPKSGAGEPAATFSATCIPVSFGGTQGEWNTFDSIDLPVSGQPVFDDGDSS